MTAPTPAVVRLGAAWLRWEHGEHADLYRPDLDAVRDWLTAALTDPDDPDSLARTLFVLDACTRAPFSAEEALLWWDRVVTEEIRVHWRSVADGLRMMLTGAGS